MLALSFSAFEPQPIGLSGLVRPRVDRAGQLSLGPRREPLLRPSQGGSSLINNLEPRLANTDAAKTNQSGAVIVHGFCLYRNESQRGQAN